MSELIRTSRLFVAYVTALSYMVTVPVQVLAQQTLPGGGNVVAGDASISAPDVNSLLIDQSSSSGIIEWDSFSIGGGNQVHFNNGTGATLNRVTGSDISHIYGSLSATGSLFLINQNGVIVGKDGVVNTGGSFVASTLDITNDDFLNGGDNTFFGTSDASVINLGKVSSLGGDVAFIAQTITNEGDIEAFNGTVGLAAGREILLRDAALDDGKFLVKIGDADSLIEEKGLISAAAVELKSNGGNIYALAGNNGGSINATGVTNSGGRIFLGAGSTGRVVTSKQIVAKREVVRNSTTKTDGGDIFINADFASIGGLLDASGALGGNISVQTAGTLSVAEPVLAVGDEGAGGTILLDAGGDLLAYTSAQIDVSGATDGGSITQLTGKTLTTSGTYLAIGQTGVGGQIDFGGGASRLLSPTIDASGATSGGRIRIGGEYQGGKDLAVDELANMLRLAVTDGTTITADATNADGDGGTVILWADEKATVLGDISVRPGSVSGNGGFIEVSAGESLSVLTSSLNTAAIDGTRGGTILLDPKNITIANVAEVDQSIFILGSGYTYPDITALETNDSFGNSVSLDGNRLAVGARGDDGSGNSVSGSGAVYLFSFSDAAFSGGVLEATLGSGYTGGKNMDVAALDDGDSFGRSVSLDGNRLAVGASSDDGSGNSVSGSGVVYLFSFSDAAFSGGVLEATLGSGYTGGKNVDVAALETNDRFGYSVSLDGNRLVVGARDDDGSGNSVSGSGAVYLFSFTDAAFSGGVLEATLGSGYTGGKNVDVAALGVEDSDLFGYSVSLDGNRLAVGASNDDGSGNAVNNNGAVYLFSFSDAAFSGGVLEATLGSGYTGGKNVDVAALDGGDRFGASVSLDGNRLAVGSFDDGSGNAVNLSGAVYLFSFSDAAFSSGVLEATLGSGYKGGKNMDVSALEFADLFGTSVSLDGNRLAVGAIGDDGSGNAVNLSGAVYLFSFSDAAFSGGVLEATLGSGYTGGKNMDVAALDDGDRFNSVSLDGNRLAVGSAYDDGSGNAVSGSGAVYLFSFSDAAFSGGVLEATLGSGYTGGKNVDVAALETFDFFGFSVSLDGNRLAVGASREDGSGNAVTTSGAVYLFSFSDAAFSGGVLEATLGSGYTGGKNVDVAALETNDLFGYSVSLDGNRLAVGAYGDDGGSGNAVSDSGAVYLFSFTDAAFSGGVLEATLGSGYTGGKNVDVAALETYDLFGFSVSLDGNRLAVGAYGDDGSGNAVSESGAVYLFSFTDAAFSGGVLEATLGSGYTGGKNVDVAALETSDQFGYSVSLDGNRLAVGSIRNDGSGNAVFDSGAVYLFSFTDAAFSGGVLEATLGSGYTGGKNVDVAALETSDQFGYSVSLDGNRLAVGANLDDGSGNVANAIGAVYLFSFTDAAFSGGVLEATLGSGYTGGKNVDVAALEIGDLFGASVSLDGNRLAVGSVRNDGSGNAVSSSGAVYLFSFSDAAFSGGVLEATLGSGYTGGKNMDVAALDVDDQFGISVSLDGNRLAVGAYIDGGSGNAVSYVGAVYLFSFTDAAFSGGVLEATLGSGYTGGKNVDVATLEANDQFGNSVSLDDNRLAVGAFDDGSGNAVNNSGAVYLFSFTDAAFSGGVLEATLGIGYTGSKNVDVATLEADDVFGTSVSLDGNRLAVGAIGDDGSGNAVNLSGAVYLFSFTDAAFSGGVLEATLGSGYTGGKNVDIAALDDGDRFGRSVSLDGNRLAVGARDDDGSGNAVSNSGAVYLILNPFGGSSAADVSNALFSTVASDDVTITPDALTALLDAGNNVVLQANNDITFDDAVIANNTSGDGGDLTVQAGRSILINANITTDNGDLTLIGNELLANGVVDADRDAGDAVITLASGVSINAGTGIVSLDLRAGTGKTNLGAGDISFVGSNMLTASQFVITNFGAEADNDISIGSGSVFNASGSGDAIVMVADTFTNSAGSGAFSFSGTGRSLVYADGLAGITRGGLTGGNLYNRAYASNLPASIMQTGNQFIYAAQPTLTITGTNTAVTYNSAIQTLSGFTVSGLVNGDTQVQALNTSPTLNGFENAATYTSGLITGGASDIGYAITLVQGQLTINQRALTITASASNKVYDGTTNVSVSLADNRIGSDVISYLATTSAFSDKHAGTGKTVSVSGITLTGADAGNYSFNTTASDTADITAKALTITASAADKIYDGGTTATLTFGDDRLGADVLTIAGTGTFADKNVGTGKTVSVSGITLTGTDASNYSFTTTASDTADITARALTITANDDSFAQSGRIYSGGAGVLGSGFATGDSLADLTGNAVYGGSSQGASAQGTYVISLSGLSSNNYQVQFGDGALTISAPVTVTQTTVIGSRTIKLEPFDSFEDDRNRILTPICTGKLLDCEAVDANLILGGLAQ